MQRPFKVRMVFILTFDVFSYNSWKQEVSLGFLDSHSRELSFDTSPHNYNEGLYHSAWLNIQKLLCCGNAPTYEVVYCEWDQWTHEFDMRKTWNWISTRSVRRIEDEGCLLCNVSVSLALLLLSWFKDFIVHFWNQYCYILRCILYRSLLWYNQTIQIWGMMHFVEANWGVAECEPFPTYSYNQNHDVLWIGETCFSKWYRLFILTI